MGYGIHALTDTTDSLEKYLINHELTPIEENDKEEWDKILESYKIEKTSETAIQIKEITKADEIKAWCIGKLKENIRSTSDTLFQKASKWCVEITTIEESLGGESKFETNPNQLATKFQDLDQTIKELINGGPNIPGNNDDIGNKVKGWCDTNRKRRFSDKDDEEIYATNITIVCLKSTVGDS